MTGSYAQYRTLNVAGLTVVDAAIDPGEATTLVLSWMISFQLLHRDACVQKIVLVPTRPASPNHNDGAGDGRSN